MNLSPLEKQSVLLTLSHLSRPQEFPNYHSPKQILQQPSCGLDIKKKNHTLRAGPSGQCFWGGSRHGMRYSLARGNRSLTEQPWGLCLSQLHPCFLTSMTWTSLFTKPCHHDALKPSVKRQKSSREMAMATTKPEMNVSSTCVEPKIIFF